MHTLHLRVRAIAAAAAAATLALAGCGSSSDGDGDGDGAITYWLWDSNQQPAYQQCATNFQEQTGIEVKIEQYGWDDYWQNVTTGFASDTAPDVFTNHLSYFPQFAAQGQLLDLSDRIEEDGLDLSIYQDGLAELWVGEDDATYGLPKDFDTIGLFYNEKAVADAGYKAEQVSSLEWNPTDGGTFEDFIGALTVDKNGVRGNEPGFDKTKVEVYGLALSGNGLNAAGQQTWSPFALSNDWYYGDTTPWTSKWNYDDPKFVETLTWYRHLIDEGYMPSVDIALSEQDPLNGYLAGRYATVTDGSWMTSSYLGQDEVATKVAPTPQGPSGARASLFNGLSDGIWAGTDKPDASWEWVKYLASEDCQDVIAESGVVLPAIKTSTKKAEQAFTDKGWDVSGFTVQVTDETTALLPIADHWSEINDTVTPAIEAFLKGSKDAESLTDANDAVNALFE